MIGISRHSLGGAIKPRMKSELGTNAGKRGFVLIVGKMRSPLTESCANCVKEKYLYVEV